MLSHYMMIYCNFKKLYLRDDLLKLSSDLCYTLMKIRIFQGEFFMKVFLWDLIKKWFHLI